ncbi:hypothetical protein ZTR_00489 [Talaromyces verruculosus]|nr:hypothetical protein ZTR_00489 [Talaromyces verruculosus]
MSGNGRRPDFEFVYFEDNKPILVRYDDFGSLDEFGDWLGNDTEEEDAMIPKEVTEWVEMTWEGSLWRTPRDDI